MDVRHEKEKRILDTTSNALFSKESNKKEEPSVKSYNQRLKVTLSSIVND